MTATISVQRNSRTEDRELSRRDWKQLIICPITGHPCEGDLAYLCPDYAVVLGKVVYRHDQRKISNTDPTLRWATTLWNPERRAEHFEMLL